MSDYIPDDDDSFNHYAADQFVPYATANSAALGLTTGDIDLLTTTLFPWSVAWPGFEQAETAFHAATQNKDSRREVLEDAIRIVAGKVQANPNVTDAQKESLGVTVRKTTRTPAPIPSAPPTLQKIDTSTRGILRLFIVDSTTPESRAKPDGVQSCEIREQIGGTAPIDPNTMSYLANETRPPYRADFAPQDIGKTVYFALRWVNTRGKTGPWSQVFSAIVPS